MTTTRNWVEIGWKEKGSGTATTKIQNNSKKAIFLIPIFCARGADPRSSPTLVDQHLAKTIPAGKCIKVNSDDYNQTRNITGFQTHILFRAANTDKIKEIPKTFYEQFIKVETVEHLVLHDELFWNDLELKCNEGKDIVDGNAVQGNKKEDTLAILEDLIKEALAKQKVLEEVIKKALAEMKILKKAGK